MKINNKQLKQIIKEELNKVLFEEIDDDKVEKAFRHIISLPFWKYEYVPALSGESANWDYLSNELESEIQSAVIEFQLNPEEKEELDKRLEYEEDLY
tara:strand:+ start:226 stop:516 length:291 start_codon:yes stop_codon:yes gene_type:complete